MIEPGRDEAKLELQDAMSRTAEACFSGRQADASTQHDVLLLVNDLLRLLQQVLMNAVIAAIAKWASRPAITESPLHSSLILSQMIFEVIFTGHLRNLYSLHCRSSTEPTTLTAALCCQMHCGD